jgi:AcrR family transcriptional regulator
MATIAYGTGRQALLEAAIRVVARQGLRGLTYRTVAAAAGVTHGSVRYHFGDWKTLVEEALTLSVTRSIDRAHLFADAGEGLSGFATTLASLVTADPDAQAFQFELALEARRRPELMATTERAYVAYRTAVADALRAHGVVDPDLAEAVMACLDGLVFQQTVFADADRTERSLAALRTLLAQATPVAGAGVGLSAGRGGTSR